ncbi:hypothetical protein J4558_21605 [Leptolyngbya sp. 15MV]|nr:hypothetical protein J4558_21605 [Leptolyngbya sp. 15MV]
MKRPVPLEQVLAGSRKADRAAMRRFFAPMRSFTTDITISEEGGRKLPILTACQMPRDDEEEPVALRGEVRLPSALVTEWEGDDVTTVLRGADDPPIQVRFVDTMALFATNHIAYSLTVVFDAGDRAVPVDTGVLLALLSLAGSAGEAAATKPSAIRFGFQGHSFALHALATARLRAPCLPRLEGEAQRQALRRAWAARDGAQPIPELSIPDEHEEVFGAVLPPIVAMLGDPPTGDTMTEVRAALCTVGPGDLCGATAEIADLDRFEDALRAIESARRYVAPFTDFTRQLAGVAQNVIDYHDQDRHEVNDSLHAAQLAGGYVHFVHRHTLVRLYRHSRSFDRMKLRVGGCPYFHLTTICAAFNEKLLREANPLIAGQRTEAARRPFILSFDGSQYADAARDLKKRLFFFERYEADAVPDLFRYETESALFRAIERQRSLACASTLTAASPCRAPTRDSPPTSQQARHRGERAKPSSPSPCRPKARDPHPSLGRSHAH